MDRWLHLSLLSLCFASCKSKPSIILRDTEGRVFAAHCDEKNQGECTLAQRIGPTWPKGQAVLGIRDTGRVVGVCNAADGHGAEPVDCRPLVCQKDADCLPAHGVPHGTCLDGLCTDQSHPIDEGDAIMLCLAGTGLGHDSLAQVEHRAMAEQCGHPCQVPSSCRQP